MASGTKNRSRPATQARDEMFIKAKLDDSSVDNVLMSIPEIDAETIYLVATAVAVALCFHGR